MRIKDSFKRLCTEEISQLAGEILERLDSEGLRDKTFSEEENVLGSVRSLGAGVPLDGAVIPRSRFFTDGTAGLLRGDVLTEQDSVIKEYGALKPPPNSFEGRVRGRAEFTEKTHGGSIYESGIVVEGPESELEKNELSESLSERFCRDSRRYDGAFERY